MVKTGDKNLLTLKNQTVKAHAQTHTHTKKYIYKVVAFYMHVKIKKTKGIDSLRHANLYLT